MARSKSDRMVAPVLHNPEERGNPSDPIDADAAHVVREAHALASGTFFTFDGESFASPARVLRREGSRRTVCPMCGCEGTGGFRCEDCADDSDARERAARLATLDN